MLNPPPFIDSLLHQAAVAYIHPGLCIRQENALTLFSTSEWMRPIVKWGVGLVICLMIRMEEFMRLLLAIVIKLANYFTTKDSMNQSVATSRAAKHYAK